MAALKSQKANAPAMMPVDGRAIIITDKYVLTAVNPGAADTLDFRIPGGMRVTDLDLIFDDIDSGTAVVFSVGYTPCDAGSALAANLTYWAGTGQTTGQAGGRFRSVSKPIKFEEDVFCRITFGTGGAGTNTGQEVHMVAGGFAEGIK